MNIRGVVLLFSLWLLSPCLSRAATRHYYIAAEDVSWNYAPSGRNLMNGNPIPQPWALRVVWPKTRFIEYTDDTFTVRKPQPEWLGILGPIIRGEVGDEIIVDFFNRSHSGHDMHPHGVRYDKADEGSLYIPVAKGAFVIPGARYTYHWFATAASGPTPGEPSSKVWWYHAHVDPGIEINAGLMGPIIITAKGKAKPDGSPKDVDREFVASFMIFNELGNNPTGQFYAINGFIFGNLPGLVIRQGEKVRWYLLGLGNEIDLHSPHWHGETVVYERRNTDVVELLPGSMKTVDMVADNPGTWMFHCHVEDHMESGMMAVYTIYAPQSRPCPLAFVRGDFWKDSEHFTMAVKNLASKPIKAMNVTAETLMTAQDLERPFGSEWTSTQVLAPGREAILEKPGMRSNSANAVMGWVLFPSLVTYEDGSTWQPRSEGECFGVIWRDPLHPAMPALPPRQIELNAD